MPDYSFRPTESIFKKRGALTDSYIPKEMVGRDAELRSYHSALQPVIENEQPSNIFLYGKSGVGKTAATRYLMSILSEDAEQVDDLDLTTIEVNCEGQNSSYQVAVNLINQLRPSENRISSTGYPAATVYDFMFEEINKQGGTVLIILDEVDHLEDDTILYKFSRAPENNDLPDAKLGVIGISNDLRYREQLNSKVRSSLCEKVVQFSAYDANELREVLSQRIDVAFYEDVVDEAVIARCAAYGARNSGDARKALDLLLESGDIARERAAERVIEQHTEEAEVKLELDEVLEGVRNYSTHGKYTLLAVMNLAENGETPCKTDTIRDLYVTMCEQEGMKPVSKRSVRDYLNELETLNVTTTTKVNKGTHGGSYKTHDVVPGMLDLKDEIVSAID